VDWTTFDNRIKDDYLDRYELLDMYAMLKEKRYTFARVHFKEGQALTHPNTNKRLRFIIEKFLLADGRG
jgi:hypothetical protein